MNVNPEAAAHLADLLHHRWTVPILAELERSRGSKYVTLQRRLGISRDSLRRTLDHLIEHGAVMRNPGYGHPMRPEYVLPNEGQELAAAARAMLDRLQRDGVAEIGLRKWSLATVLAVEQGADRFSALEMQLPGASPRALTTTLRQLTGAGLLERVVIDDYPPRTHYRATPLAARWRPALERLAAAAAGFRES